ncbi:MAG: ABC transporter permease [Candidatus Sumerlaeia bacterium]
MNRLEMLLHDLRYSVRSLARTPVFTAIAVLTLALGIAGATIVFGVLKKIAIDPLPYPASDRLVSVYMADASGARSIKKLPFSYPNYSDLRTQNRSFSEVGAFKFNLFTVGAETPALVYGLNCTASLGRVLGLRMALGRWFSDADEREDAAAVVVLGNQFWRSRFNADRDVIGRRVTINKRECTVVGVMAEGVPIYSRWRFADCGDVFLPETDRPRASRGQRSFAVVGRLKAGVGEQAVKVDMGALGDRLAQAYPGPNSRLTIRTEPYAAEVFGVLAKGLVMMEGAVLIVMLLACANVAGMLLARSARRRPEFALRAALGGGRWPMIRLLTIENMLLSLAACLGALFLTGWGLAALSQAAPSALVSRGRFQVDATVLIFAIVMAGLTMLLAGIIPALIATRGDIAAALKEGMAQQSGSLARMRHYRFLVAIQVALTLLLVNTALSLSYYYRGIVEEAAAISSDSVLTARLDFSNTAGRNANTILAMQKEIVREMHSVAGVSAVGLATKLPFEGGYNSSILVDNEAYDPQAHRRLAEFSFVSTGYFGAIGLNLLQGRVFAESDDRHSTGVVIVNETLAGTCWPGQNPIGKRVRPDDPHPYYDARVIGVVADARQHGAQGRVMPEVYLPASVSAADPYSIVIRAAGNTQPAAYALRDCLRRISPETPLANLRTMAEIFGASTKLLRFQMIVINCFMALALLLAAVGIYGTLSFFVVTATREIGIRMAMGASKRVIRNLVFAKVVPSLCIGVVVGGFGAGFAGKLVNSMTYGAGRFSPAYLAGASAIVFCVAALACWIPVRRATAVDPNVALRAD